jgi:hypothetical protein
MGSFAREPKDERIRQAGLIAYSLAGLTQDWISSAPTSILGPKMSTRPFVRPSDPKQLLRRQQNASKQCNRPLASRSAEIGMRLARETIWHGDRCTWLGAEMLGPGLTSYGTLRPDVYSGTAGVGLPRRSVAGGAHRRGPPGRARRDPSGASCGSWPARDKSTRALHRGSWCLLGGGAGSSLARRVGAGRRSCDPVAALPGS